MPAVTVALDVVNLALNVLGEARATSAADSSSLITRLNAVVVERAKAALAEYPWNFAEVVEQLTAAEPVPVDFAYGFTKPVSWLRTCAVDKTTEYHGDGIRYADRGGRILTDQATTYLRYVSDTFATLYGTWPMPFALYVAALMAEEVAPSVSTSEAKIKEIGGTVTTRRRAAQRWDAQQKPPRPQTYSRWDRARNGGYMGGDRGQG